MCEIKAFLMLIDIIFLEYLLLWRSNQEKVEPWPMLTSTAKEPVKV